MKGLAAVMLRSSQATNDAEAVRVLRASLLSMHEKLADKDSALQRLAALHARLLAAHDDLQAESTAGAMPRHTALRQSSRDSAVGELKISALAVDEEPHWIAMAPAAGSTAELEGVGGSIVSDANHRQGRERHHQRSRCSQLHQAYREKEELVAWTRT